MNATSDDTYLGSAASYKERKLATAKGYVQLTARVMIVGFEPGHGNYVGVDFTPPPLEGPLGVTTLWDDRGVDLARFAMAHDKRLIILYRTHGFTWGDIRDLAVENL